ncbi:DUF2380 domain-containing protein [Labrys sp. LIt4]|uniref:DUF2380 domain-containing protein n=1 Tax=Labrys TaxID=204476 RepID=UPI0015E337DB|nr:MULTISPECIES: DUF2380 domain-containing protein [Labrys]MBP0580576.1 DUF2380 domain-containing protein [Labrys sp. LIt4]
MTALVLLAMAAALPSHGRAGEAGKALLALPFGYLDTSGEASDQKEAHADRLKAMSTRLTDRLQAGGSYRIVPATPGIIACASNDQDCLLGEARKAGADLILTGAVHKTSTLISAIWVGVFDAKDGKRTFFRQISFRGDTNEAWQHATDFVAGQLQEEARQAR